jgi:hypothetical protein
MAILPILAGIQHVSQAFLPADYFPLIWMGQNGNM